MAELMRAGLLGGMHPELASDIEPSFHEESLERLLEEVALEHVPSDEIAQAQDISDEGYGPNYMNELSSFINFANQVMSGG